MTVTIVEVSPRDGLQNEPVHIPTDLKIEFINMLSKTGLTHIEATSFVSPKWVPQMADHSQVMQGIHRNDHITFSALVPNIQGLEDAISAGVKEIAVFTAASQSFSQKNTNRSISSSLQEIKKIMPRASEAGVRVRGYISCVLGCPYEGDVPYATTAEIAEKLVTLGCYQVSLGDTIGVGTANKAKTLIKTVASAIPLQSIATHFHDTYGQALTNIFACLDAGITTIDSAAAGLGGCPYAPGAGGNVATEDVVYLLNGLGVKTNIDLNKVALAGRMICDFIKQPSRSKVSLALAQATYQHTTS